MRPHSIAQISPSLAKPLVPARHLAWRMNVRCATFAPCARASPITPSLRRLPPP